MIRMIPSYSAEHAKTYFSDALSKSDYYIADQELQGHFDGKLAERLGIKGPASKEVFFALCENRTPGTNKPLTPRTNENRITGYDINFHVPKSVSIIHALSNDGHILNAFQQSVSETMKDIEADSKTRVRKGYKYDDRATGELLWAEFIHQTARAVEGHLPDPHLHIHAYVMNATFDKDEGKIKAGKFRDIKRSMPYYQARFHKRLADKMIDLGYQVRRTNSSFEIEGVPQAINDHFSKRTNDIGKVAKEKGIVNAKDLDALGSRTRSKKQKGLSMSALKNDWKKQIRAVSEALNVNSDIAIRYMPAPERKIMKADNCIDHSLKHHFERASVMEDRRVLLTAYRYALGNNSVSIEDITNAFKNDERFIHVRNGSRSLCTTKEVLKEEKKMVELARTGHGKMTPMYRSAPSINLKGQQKDAVSHVLTTKNRVSIILGGAGTGKTKLMEEARELIKKAGKKVMAVAPTAEASRGVLKSEGFENAETIARLLIDEKLQEELQDQVLWVDESGLVGTKDMGELLALATKKNARIILGGDTRQHASVVRGDALRILNTIGGIRTSEVSKIFRQKNEKYKCAVEDLSKGNMKDAFEKLDKMGSIKTIDPMMPNETIVDDYISLLKNKKTALIISPTHKEGERVTEDVRKKLRMEKMIGEKEIFARKLTSLNFTEAEKSDPGNYKNDQVIQFNQNIKKIGRGSIWRVREIKENEIVIVSNTEQSVMLPINKAKYFDVFKQTEIALSKGDKIKITRNAMDVKKRRLNNGMNLEVASVNKKGRIILKNVESKARYELDNNFGHISHAHCITSYASQGKTVDEVLIAQPASTFGATDAKQFYVSVSRGRHNVKIYTDDKNALLENVSEIGDRQSALELTGEKYKHSKYVDTQIRNTKRTPSQNKEAVKEYFNNKQNIEREYEFGF